MEKNNEKVDKFGLQKIVQYGLGSLHANHKARTRVEQELEKADVWALLRGVLSTKVGKSHQIVTRH